MPPNETFADLLRQAGIDRPAWEGVQNQRPPRPLPRQMRPPAQRANDPRLAQSERNRALRQFESANAANMDTYQRQGFGQTNQLDQFRRDLSESTGAPALARSGLALNNWRQRPGTPEGAQDLADAAVNFGAGSLGVLGMAGLAPRAPVRGALRPPVAAPDVEPPLRITRPPTEIAPNGMPIAAPRPFRNSLRGGSSDLMDAAGMRTDTPASRPSAIPAGGALRNPPRFEPQPMGPRPGVVDRGADGVNGRPWTSDDIARAQEMRRSGATTRTIGEALGRSPGDVSRRLSAVSPPERPRGFDARLSPDEGYAAQRSLDGLTPTQIAEEMDLPVGQVRVALNSARRKAPDLSIPLGRRQPSELTQRITALKNQGLNRAQIAERLGVTPAQVNSALISARQTRRVAANTAQPPRTAK